MQVVSVSCKHVQHISETTPSSPFASALKKQDLEACQRKLVIYLVPLPLIIPCFVAKLLRITGIYFRVFLVICDDTYSDLKDLEHDGVTGQNTKN